MPTRHEVNEKVSNILSDLDIEYDRVDVDWNKQAGGGMRIAVGIRTDSETKEKVEALIAKEYPGVSIMLFDLGA